ncbi:flagellar motor switch protein FliN [Spongiibacter nanhainus]|uniref:Flagellar motor switch protein FliN n=1 Tax=Spongiibacter nanhainus TaxID=2794344 RepID=A0A7T4QXU2_9GAMM|nr:flagellar motor switch protein FliN [Spongiibacter nanhainus]QQD16794.1 flagellar motor switch protein FliN [Spongiibacter nanhainus]
MQDNEQARSGDGIANQRLRERSTSTPELDRVLDIPVNLTLEVGGTELPIRELLELQQGAVVELAKQAGDPLDVKVNGTLIARGEVVVVDDRLGVRLTEVVSAAERLQSLR